MTRRLYLITRDLHLYTGLFLAPYILVFAVSVFWLVHPPWSRPPQPGPARQAAGLALPPGIENLSGRDQVAALRPVLRQIGVEGEINFIRRIAKEHRLVVPVLLPGRETTVDIDVLQRTAAVSERSTGLLDAAIHLHKMPGPHNVEIRGNSAYMRVWRWLADISSYGILFLTLSGVYLWAMLRAERRVGLALLAMGAVSFFGLAYGIAS